MTDSTPRQGKDASVGSAFYDLVALMETLRSPSGCEWDARQTHGSLVKYVLEEAYEVAEAVETGNAADLEEELGDLMLQVVFHASIASEAGEFDIDDVSRGIVAKLVRRHPQVFADEADPDSDRDIAWDLLKAQEKKRTSVLEGIPAHQSALARAQKVVARARRGGVPASPPTEADDLGARLLQLVFEADAAGVDAEAALRRVTRSVEAAIRASESSQ